MELFKYFVITKKNYVIPDNYLDSTYYGIAICGWKQGAYLDDLRYRFRYNYLNDKRFLSRSHFNNGYMKDMLTYLNNKRNFSCSYWHVDCRADPNQKLRTVMFYQLGFYYHWTLYDKVLRIKLITCDV